MKYKYWHTHTHTHTRFNGPLSGTNRVSRYQKGKPIWILLKQETVSGSGISWAICKSAPHSRQITTPAPNHSVFYRPDALPAAQPTASEHWRHILTCAILNTNSPQTNNVNYIMHKHSTHSLLVAEPAQQYSFILMDKLYETLCNIECHTKLAFTGIKSENVL